MVSELLNKESEFISILPTLKKFLKQSRDGGHSIRDYIRSYNNLRVKVYFDKVGNDQISWIAFPNSGINLTTGFYPLYLYYRKQNKLLLCYGNAGTQESNWIRNDQVWEEFFTQNRAKFYAPTVRDYFDSSDKYNAPRTVWDDSRVAVVYEPGDNYGSKFSMHPIESLGHTEGETFDIFDIVYGFDFPSGKELTKLLGPDVMLYSHLVIKDDIEDGYITRKFNDTHFHKLEHDDKALLLVAWEYKKSLIENRKAERENRKTERQKRYKTQSDKNKLEPFWHSYSELINKRVANISNPTKSGEGERPWDIDTYNDNSDAYQKKDLNEYEGLNRYEKKDLIIKTTNAVLYRGTDKITKEDVAIKEIINQGNFGREYKILDQIKNTEIKGVTRLRDYDKKNPIPEFFVFPYRKNGNLRDKIKGFSNPDKDIDSIDKDICINIILRTLSSLHEKDIVHRDLKPENILIDDYGYPEITDFGLSKDFHTTLSDNDHGTVGIGGTFTYAAPEQFKKDQETGPYTDVFSLAFIIYEILMDGLKPSFTYEGAAKDRLDYQKHVSKTHKSYNKKIDLVLQKALSIDPKERYRDAKEFMEAFDNAKSNKRNYSLNFSKLSKIPNYLFYISLFTFLAIAISTIFFMLFGQTITLSLYS